MEFVIKGLFKDRKIGKRSKVYEICYLTMKEKYNPDKVIEFEEIKRLALR